MGKRVKPFSVCDLSSTRDRHYRMKLTFRNTLVRPDLWDPKPKILSLQGPPPERLFVDNPRPQQEAVFIQTTPQDVMRQYKLYGDNN